jgi:small subunit ribosomal protein S4
MGDPKRQRKKFSKPGHPWKKDRIDAEKEILKQYGLRRKAEIWKTNSMLQSFLNRAKTIIGKRTKQSDVEKKQLLDRLHVLGLLQKDSKIEDVLNLTLKNFMERRLQTLVFRKQLANSVMQARQFITHEHILVGKRKVTSPAYLVSSSEESHIKLTKQLNVVPAKDTKVEAKTEEAKA